MKAKIKRAFPLFLATLTVTAAVSSAIVSVMAENENPGDSQNVTSTVVPEDSLFNSNKAMPDTWVFTDGLGRTSVTNADVGNVREDKTVIMFYWDWHDELGEKGCVNTTEFMKLYPEAKNDYNHEAWKGTGHYCFWNEPIYGFYRTSDEWVLRRQAEMLANAGIDAVFNDNTNGSFTWQSGYTAMYEEWTKALADGVAVPKISYVLPFAANDGSNSQIEALYNDIYKDGKYQDLWFYWEDKPMLMAHSNSTYRSFFSWRGGQAAYVMENTAYKQWGWLSTYPQALYYSTGKDRRDGIVEQMSVGVAVNHSYVTNEITAMNGENVMGRSYTSEYPDRYDKEENSSLWGYNFSEQFDYALEIDPKVVFITGYNEWHAWRQPSPWGGPNSLVNNALVDQFDNEFSRDIEPTKGELKDHYYYLMVNYVRKYKGCNPIPEPTLQKTIDINGDITQWEDVGPYFASYIGNTGDRDHEGYDGYYYTETSGRNDIIGAQVARDDEYVYFNIECAEDITPYTDKLWMTLYIDSDQENQGWETFDYVVNKSAASASTAVLEKFTGEGYNSEKVADVEYKVTGRYMVVKISKASLGLEGNDYTINFSCTDNVHDEGNYDVFSGDIMDFYISGDVAPGARFKYSYISTQDNSVETLPETDPPATEPQTEAPGTEAPQTDSSTDDGSENSEGCKSVFGGTSVALVSVMVGAAMFVTKKKRN